MEPYIKYKKSKDQYRIIWFFVFYFLIFSFAKFRSKDLQVMSLTLFQLSYKAIYIFFFYF